MGLLLTVPTYSQSCKRIYKDKLETSSKLIRCGGNFTLEKLKTGYCILKRYYPETKQITHLATYKSDKFEELHGHYEERWDDGTIVNSGMYENNLRTGQWRESVNQIGFYNQGVRHGEWKTYNGDTLVVRISNYINGKLNGEQLKLDSLGNIVLKEEYKNGDLVSTTADTSTVYKEEMPIFPGCEDQNLKGEELQSCSQKKLLEYVYGKLRYPKNSRELNIQGKALVQFVIDKDGNVIDIKMLNGVANDIKNEILSLVNNMPKWKPGIQDGKPVKVLFTLPVIFKLD